MSSSEEIVIVIGWKHIIIALVVIAGLALAWQYFSKNLGPNLILSTNKTEYRPGDLVVIEGRARGSWYIPLASEPVAIEVRGEDNIVWLDQVSTDSSGYFTSSFRLREDSSDGVYSVYASVMLAQGVTTFTVRH